MQKSRLYIVLIAFLLVSCVDHEPSNQSKIAKPATNVMLTEDSLARFVARSVIIAVSQSKAELGSILSALKNDSVRFTQTVDFLNKPFSDPNSPFRNEELYITLLNAQLGSSWYSKIEQSVIDGKLQLALQNRPGNPANDFSYLTPEGVKKSMYAVKAPYTLVYFYNPECNACKETKELIQSSNILSRNIQYGRLKVIAIYTDFDELLWRKHLPENPSQWINGRDINKYLWKNKIYDLRAIPTLYLLDKEKKVLLKDASVNQVEQILQMQ